MSKELFEAMAQSIIDGEEEDAVELNQYNASAIINHLRKKGVEITQTVINAWRTERRGVRPANRTSCVLSCASRA